jgi:AcrR family transcriptional regulator
VTPRSDTSVESLDGYEKGRVPRDVRERQLLEVAELTFARLGYQGASLEEVARQAGVTRQYISKLFRDKEGLYLACHARARDQLEQRLLAVSAELPADPGELDARLVLRQGLEAYFRFVQERGSGWDVLFGGGAAVAGSAAGEVERLRAHTVGLIAALVTAALPSVASEDADVYAAAMSGAGEQVARWWRCHDDVSLDDVVDRLVTVFADGIAQFSDR